MKDAIRSCMKEGTGQIVSLFRHETARHISEPDPPRRPRDTVILLLTLLAGKSRRPWGSDPRFPNNVPKKTVEWSACSYQLARWTPRALVLWDDWGALARRVLNFVQLQRQLESSRTTRVMTGKEGMAPTKATMVSCFRLVAKALGWKDEDCKTITGHTFRCTGAQYFARLGVDYYKIQLFCRWGSDTILKYLRDIPLEGSEDWLNQAMEGRHQSVEEICFQAFASVKNLDKKVKEQDVEKIVLKTLECHSTDVLTQVTLKHEELVKALDSIKQPQLVMDDHWAADLSRSFLPKFVRNSGSGKVHAVRDDSCAGCGFVFKNSKHFTLVYSIPEKARRCKAAGCAKLFQRYAPPEPSCTKFDWPTVLGCSWGCWWVFTHPKEDRLWVGRYVVGQGCWHHNFANKTKKNRVLRRQRIRPAKRNVGWEGLVLFWACWVMNCCGAHLLCVWTI